MKGSSRWRGVAAGASAVGLAVVARAVRSRLRALAPVPRDMRSPGLWVPIEVSSTFRLRLLRRLPVAAGAVAPGVDVEKRDLPARDGAPPVEVYVYVPAVRQPRSGALLWIHGGGYVLGHPVRDHPACSRFAGELGVVVVSVHYRLAPEHPFPAALEDCHAALRWLHDHADDLGVERTRIAVGGESAGGGLAAALVQLAHDRGDVPVCFQLLVYPMLDDRTALDRTKSTTLLWSPASNRFGWTAYLGHPPRADEARPYAVPARRADLTGLAPAWISVGDIDLFHDEDVDYAARLAAAGVPCQLELVTGMYHGAFSVAPEGSVTVTAFKDSAVRALGTAITGA